MICYLYNYSLSRKLLASRSRPVTRGYDLEKCPFSLEISARQMLNRWKIKWKDVVVFNRYLREHFVLPRTFTPPRQLANWHSADEKSASFVFVPRVLFSPPSEKDRPWEQSEIRLRRWRETTIRGLKTSTANFCTNDRNTMFPCSTQGWN